MKKSEIKSQILQKIEIMEQNTYLFQKSWSNNIEMIDFDWNYRTYNSGTIGVNRYHNIEIFTLNKKILEMLFRGNSIHIIQDLDAKPINLKDVLFYVEAIFEEKHSFKNHNEGKRKIRETITMKMAGIESAKNEIIALKQQLIDINTL